MNVQETLTSLIGRADAVEGQLNKALIESKDYTERLCSTVKSNSDRATSNQSLVNAMFETKLAALEKRVKTIIIVAAVINVAISIYLVLA